MRFSPPLILACILVLQGCVAIQTYPGPARPDDQISKIVPKIGVYGVASKEIAVVSFDGGVVSEPLPVMEVLPGRHLVGLRYEGGAGSILVSNDAPCYLVIEAEAGINFHVNGEYR